jgi:cytosine/adenosine deaminase-related metal-dependent hydrolase
MRNSESNESTHRTTFLRDIRYASGPNVCTYGSLEIAGGRIARIYQGDSRPNKDSSGIEINLSGFLVMPGLINAHDHLQFALHPRLGNPPYRNYVEWGEDIHATLADVINTYKQIPKQVRLWWGGIRNLLCGVTTVCHHDTLWSELKRSDFPVRVVQQYGWAHSLAQGGDLIEARRATPQNAPFIVHASEGVDARAQQEILALDRLGVLDANAVLVHGLAMDDAGIAVMQERRASLIVCPSSNHFLFRKLPSSKSIHKIENTSLGSDSPITGIGDLLDEIRFTIAHCGIDPEKAYRMVTEAPAKSLRLHDGEGNISEGGVADLIAIRDTGERAAAQLSGLSMVDIELVLLGGQVQLASDHVFGLLPSHVKQGMECLWINGILRWLRAPVSLLLREAEAVVGRDNAYLGGKPMQSSQL